MQDNFDEKELFQEIGFSERSIPLASQRHTIHTLQSKHHGCSSSLPLTPDLAALSVPIIFKTHFVKALTEGNPSHSIFSFARLPG